MKNSSKKINIYKKKSVRDSINNNLPQRKKVPEKTLKVIISRKKPLYQKKPTLTLSETLNPTQPLTTLNNPKHKTTLNPKQNLSLTQP